MHEKFARESVCGWVHGSGGGGGGYSRERARCGVFVACLRRVFH